MTFHEELERVLSPARYAVGAGPPANPSALLTSARTAVGDGFAVTNLRFPERAGEPVIASARAKGGSVEGRPPRSRRVWLDASSARVLDIADPRAGFLGVMHQLHGSLLVPGVGRKIVGWMGWSLLVSCLTGLWLWWPRGGAVLKGLRWRRGAFFTINFHHLLGFWILFPLVILAATGIYISFPQSARAITQWATHAETRDPQRDSAPQRGGAPLTHTHLPIDEVAAIAHAAAPNADLVVLTLPTRPRGDDAPSWRAELRDARVAQTVHVTIDDTSGEAKLREGGGNDGVAFAIRRIHDGGEQAMWWRTLIALAGLAPTLLGITGLIMWLKSRAVKNPRTSL